MLMAALLLGLVEIYVCILSVPLKSQFRSGYELKNSRFLHVEGIQISHVYGILLSQPPLYRSIFFWGLTWLSTQSRVIE